MKYPKIKSAVEMGYICGLHTLCEAIRNWDRSLSHGDYTKIAENVRQRGIELDSCNTEILDLTLEEANIVLNLGIDFNALDEEINGLINPADDIPWH